MADVQVVCGYCGKTFFKSSGSHKWAVKQGWSPRCSKECQSKSRILYELRNCTTCGKEIQVGASLIAKSKTQRFFCSKSCAAKTTNRGRHRTEQEKDKIRKSLSDKGLVKRIKHVCAVCEKEFYARPRLERITCSFSCGQIYSHGSLPYNKEELIAFVENLITTDNATPSSKLVPSSIRRAALKFFGSWNKLIESLGCDTNQQWVQRKPTCKDGHVADSVSEMKVDNWLSQQGFAHERHKKYPEGKFTCDFYLPAKDLWVEYFGLVNFSWYRETMETKQIIAERHGLRLVGIVPSDLYPKNKLSSLIE